RRDPLVGETVDGELICGDQAGDLRAVAEVVQRIVVVVDKVPPADNLVPRPESRAERGVVVVDAGVEDGDGLPGAGEVWKVGASGVEANELVGCAPRREQRALFQRLGTHQQFTAARHLTARLIDYSARGTAAGIGI